MFNTINYNNGYYKGEVDERGKDTEKELTTGVMEVTLEENGVKIKLFQENIIGQLALIMKEQ